MLFRNFDFVREASSGQKVEVHYRGTLHKSDHISVLIRFILFGARAWMKQNGLKLFVQSMDALISYPVNCFKMYIISFFSFSQ